MNAFISRRGFSLLGAASVTVAGLGLLGCSPDGSGAAKAGSSAASGEGLADVEVKISSGTVVGTELKDGVVSWYGIPYGKTPAGDLRWKAPEAPEAWDSELDCTTLPEKALQLSGTEVIGTEDCLNLTVTSKLGHAKKPVLVFLHGGNNQTGDASEIVGDDMVANADCVYVSLNYRLGLLGFNCLPSLVKDDGATGNFALLDIALALDWVKENIEVFGGDPANITVSGFSAGGRDVMAMLISPLFKDKFQKAIVYSGGMTTCSQDTAAVQIARAIAPLAVEDGKAVDEASAETWLLGDGGEVAGYLMGIDAKRLAPLMGNAGIRMAVFPHLYEDDVVIPRGGFVGALYNDVPVIMLTGSGEFTMFSLGDAWWKGDGAAVIPADQMTAAQAFSNTYGSDMYRIFNAQESANLMVENYESGIYVCQVNYGGDDSAMSADLQPYGSFHGIFVPMLATENQYAAMMPGVFDKAGYTAMAEVYNSYLKNFLASGDPNGDDLEEWQVWDRDTQLSLVLDGDESQALVSCENVSTTYGAIVAAMQADETLGDEAKDAVAKNVMNGRWFSTFLDEYYGGGWAN